VAAPFAAKEALEAHRLARAIIAAIVFKVIARVYASIETFLRGHNALRSSFK
jgi:hypothetical protein